jgi:uncharacterized protein YndB with AHSA1/START domain
VFGALVDPAVTTRFWLTRSTGKLAAGGRVRWDWEMLGRFDDVNVRAVEENDRAVVRWPAYGGGTRTTVEWRFAPRPDDTTFVAVTDTGIPGDQDAIARQAIGAIGGFTLVLAGMKAWLEHGIELNLIRDRPPDGADHQARRPEADPPPRRANDLLPPPARPRERAGDAQPPELPAGPRPLSTAQRGGRRASGFTRPPSGPLNRCPSNG